MYKAGKVWLPDADIHFRALFEQGGEYFLDRLRKAMELVPDKGEKIALDIGAHVGHYTAEMTKVFRHVWAFEPAADSFECLWKNLEDCHNVTIARTAVGGGVGRGRMHDDTSRPTRVGNTGARFWKPDPEGDVLTTYIDIFQFQNVGFLKVDVEGMDLEVLAGAEETLERCKPVVMVEVGKAPPDRYGLPADAPIKYLERLGAREVLRMKSDRVFMWGGGGGGGEKKSLHRL